MLIRYAVCVLRSVAWHEAVYNFTIPTSAVHPASAAGFPPLRLSVLAIPSAQERDGKVMSRSFFELWELISGWEPGLELRR